MAQYFGASTPELAQMEDNLSYMKHFQPLNEAEQTDVQKVRCDNNGMSMAASFHMMEMLIEKASKYGMAV